MMMQGSGRGTRPRKTLVALVIAGVSASATMHAATPPVPASPSDTGTLRPIPDVVAKLERHQGLLDVYLDHKGGRVLVALKGDGEAGRLGRFLYQTYLRSGLGSTPVGLDR